MSAELFKPGSIAGYDDLETLTAKASNLHDAITEHAYALCDPSQVNNTAKNPGLLYYGQLLARALDPSGNPLATEATVLQTLDLSIDLCRIVLPPNEKDIPLSFSSFYEHTGDKPMSYLLLEAPAIYVNVRPRLAEATKAVASHAAALPEHADLARSVASLMLRQVEEARFSAFNDALAANFAKSLDVWGGILPEN